MVKDTVRIPDTGTRKQVAVAIRTLLVKYFKGKLLWENGLGAFVFSMRLSDIVKFII